MQTMGKLLLIGLVIGLPVGARAGDSGRTGTAGALELVIPTDARGAAMGGSVIAATEGTAAWYWNPAGAAQTMGTEFAVARREYIAGIALNNLSFARNAGALGVIGFSVKALTVGDEPVYTTGQPDGTGEVFSSSFVVVGMSWARAITDHVDFGLTGNYIAEKISRETAYGVAFDMGFLYRPSFGGMTIGIVVKNYGPKMKFNGPDFGGDIIIGDGSQDQTHTGRTQSASFELPSYFQVGVAWDPLVSNNQHLRMTGAFQSNNFSEDEFRLGTEWGIADELFLRGGYRASRQENYVFGFSAGAGLRLPLGDTQTTLDYTWTDAGVFESNHFFSLKLQF